MERRSVDRLHARAPHPHQSPHRRDAARHRLVPARRQGAHTAAVVASPPDGRAVGLRTHCFLRSVTSVSALTAMAASRAVTNTPHIPMAIDSARVMSNFGAKSP